MLAAAPEAVDSVALETSGLEAVGAELTSEVVAEIDPLVRATGRPPSSLRIRIEWLDADAFHYAIKASFDETIPDDQHLRVGIVEHVGQLVGHPVPVDGHEGGAQMGVGHQQLEELPPVAHHGHDGVARFETGTAQAVAEPGDAIAQLGPGGRAVVVDQRGLIGMGLGMAVDEYRHLRGAA